RKRLPHPLLRLCIVLGAHAQANDPLHNEPEDAQQVQAGEHDQQDARHIGFRPGSFLRAVLGIPALLVPVLALSFPPGRTRWLVWCVSRRIKAHLFSPESTTSASAESAVL